MYLSLFGLFKKKSHTIGLSKNDFPELPLYFWTCYVWQEIFLDKSSSEQYLGDK